jgi:hypothetical protein
MPKFSIIIVTESGNKYFGPAMRVTVELPPDVVDDLQRVTKSQLGYRDLSLPQAIGISVAYSLFSCGQTEDPNVEQQFIDLAWKLVTLQPVGRD